jgi:hypothetical protein
MEYKEYKDLEEHLNYLLRYNKEKYYELLLLKGIYDRLNLFEVNKESYCVNDICYEKVEITKEKN